MNDRAVIHSLETGLGRRVAILCASLVAVAIVVWALAAGFRNEHPYRSADALVHATDTPAKVSPTQATPPPAPTTPRY